MEQKNENEIECSKRATVEVDKQLQIIGGIRK